MGREPSTTHVFAGWQAGDNSAANELFDRYSHRLSVLAERKIGHLLRKRTTARDIAQSALGSFFRRWSRGEFTIDSCGDLWRLLVAITLHKIQQRVEREGAQRRDFKREVLSDPSWLDGRVSGEPWPVDIVLVADEVARLQADLSPREREILRLWLEGHRPRQIAKQVGCTRTTVWRTKERIRRRLEGMGS